MTLFRGSLCFAPRASSDEGPQREEERLSRQQVFRFMSYSAAVCKHNASFEGIYCVTKDIVCLNIEAKNRLDWQTPLLV